MKGAFSFHSALFSPRKRAAKGRHRKVSGEVHEGGIQKKKIWKDDKEMAQDLRLEAILPVPPPLPLPLIIAVFQPSSLKMPSSKEDVVVVVVRNIVHVSVS